MIHAFFIDSYDMAGKRCFIYDVAKLSVKQIKGKKALLYQYECNSQI